VKAPERGEEGDELEQRIALAGGLGSLTLREEGPRLWARAELPDDGRGLYKVWLTGRNGRALLGTLVPETGGRLAAERTFTADALRRQGTWPVTGGTAELTFSFHNDGPPAGWTWERPNGEAFRDRCIRSAAAGLDRVLVRREGERWTMACPFAFDREFPLLPLFCFSRLKQWDKGLFCLFSFDADGAPLMPGK